MSEIKEYVTIPEQKILKIIALRCDICNKQMELPSIQVRTEIEIAKREVSYDSGETERYHCCPDCWTTHIVPLFKNPATIHDW